MITTQQLIKNSTLVEDAYEGKLQECLACDGPRHRMYIHRVKLKGEHAKGAARAIRNIANALLKSEGWES